MSDTLNSKKGTIANVLTKHKNEIYALCETPSQLPNLHSKVMEILDSDELSKNNAVDKAKAVLTKCLRNYNLYISTLVTYMSGIKMS